MHWGVLNYSAYKPTTINKWSSGQWSNLTMILLIWYDDHDSSDDRSMIHHHLWCHRLRISPDSPNFRVNFTSLFSITKWALEIIIILFYFFWFFWNNIFIFPVVKGELDVRMLLKYLICIIIHFETQPVMSFVFFVGSLMACTWIKLMVWTGLSALPCALDTLQVWWSRGVNFVCIGTKASDRADKGVMGL